MQTLHDLLKHEPEAAKPRPAQQDELRGRYSKIGISAVAAATQFNRNKDVPAGQGNVDRAADRSSTRR